jgi:outer membrane receptor for Fe3+-dicitrate
MAMLAGPMAAQTATFKGLVLTDSSERPIPGATVAIDALKLQATSDSLGRFTIVGVAPGVHTVVARKIGFTPIATRVVFGTGATLEADLILSPNSAQALTEVIVETKKAAPLHGKLAEFEERRLAGVGGQFLTQAELEKKSSSVLSNVLRQVPGVDLVRYGGQYFVAGGRMPGRGNLPCPAAVMLDGVFIYGAGNPSEPRFGIDQINTNTLAGVEFYSGGASMPVKYNATRHTCGLLVLWTK